MCQVWFKYGASAGTRGNTLPRIEFSARQRQLPVVMILAARDRENNDLEKRIQFFFTVSGDICLV